jgi:hypothetical protein
MAAVVPIIIPINNSAAERKACVASVKGYRHDEATVAEMRTYSSCIDRLHPNPIGPEATLLLKVAVAVVLIGMVVGAVRAVWRDGWSDIGWGAFHGFASAFFGQIAIGLVVVAVVFVFS